MDKEDISFICSCVAFCILVYVVANVNLNLYEKIWCVFCMGAQLLFIAKYVSNTKSRSINLLVDEALYSAMVLSIFIDNPVLLQIQILVLIAILLLRIIYGECILTKSKWKTLTRIGYVGLFIITTSKCLRNS